MNASGPEWTPLTWRQLLAAEADGELDSATSRRLRDWLAERPDWLDRLGAQEWLSPVNEDFWQGVRAPSPTADEWQSVWRRIRTALDAPTPAPRRSWLGRGFLSAAIALPATIVAAAMLAVVLHAPPPSDSPPHPSEDPIDTVFAVAGQDDVEILSIRNEDVANLVVGQAPFSFTMTLATPGDVRLDGVAPAPDGMVPEVQMGWNEAPMVFASTSRSP